MHRVDFGEGASGSSMAMEMPIMHDSDRYELIRDIGYGNCGVARLMRDKLVQELVAVKYIERGEKIDENVQREIINHRSLCHPNIIRFKEVILTPTHLAIVMEYAAGGELFKRICNAVRFDEDEARFFFQQLISGVSYFHSMNVWHTISIVTAYVKRIDSEYAVGKEGHVYFLYSGNAQVKCSINCCYCSPAFLEVCHRDLKLENTLLDGSPAPRLKICDFGYSKSSLLHSQPKSTVGTPAYIAPEVFAKKEYDGKIADVWSCGVTLYVMLVGSYPFEDPAEPKDFRKTIGRIMRVQYAIPDFVQISSECRHLLSRIFVSNPTMRISMTEIKNHVWFLKNLPADLLDGGMSNQYDYTNQSLQSTDEIMRIIAEAKIPAQGFGLSQYLGDDLDFDDMDLENDSDLDIDSSGEIVYVM